VELIQFVKQRFNLTVLLIEHQMGLVMNLCERLVVMDFGQIIAEMRQGDKAAKDILSTYINDIAEGLINLANILRPEIILIGGGVSNEEELLIKPLEDIVNKYAYGGNLNPRIVVKKAKLKNDAGLVGAACLIMKK
jgi:predicted NBD/HSP70 family sugar kinase